MRKVLIALAVSAAAASVQAQGVPTNDVQAAIAAARQLETLRQQVMYMKRQLDSFNGNRGFAALLGNPMVRDNMPKDARDVYDASRRLQYGGIDGALSEIERAEKYTGSLPDMQRDIDKRQVDLARTSKAVRTQAYADMQKELDNLDMLGAQINRTSDPKAIAELQAVLATTQARISVKKAKIDLLAQLADSERQLTEDSRRVAEKRLFDPTISATPTVRFP